MIISHSGPFQGETPLIDPRVSDAAQASRNVYRRHGTLKAEKGPAAVQPLPGVPNPGNLYRYDVGNAGEGFWFSWSRSLDIDVVRSPIANDAYERVYWTGDNAPKMGGIDIVTSGDGPYPSAQYRLGVPAPGSAPTVSEPDDRVDPDDDAVEFPPVTALETVYVVTCITQYGEESAPSLPSAAILRWDDTDDSPAGGSVVVELPPVPGGNNDIVTMRIYRAESGDTYQFVADVEAGTATFHDNVASENLGAAIPSIEWDMPDASLRGLTALPNGVLAGFFGNTVAFSHPYYPHAWPVGYQLAFDNPVVAICSIGTGLVVLTTGQPWLVSGIDPAAMSQMKLDANQACLSKRSVVDMGGYALYASPDGLVAVNGNEATVVTRNVFSRDQWQALKPETIHAYRHDGSYVAFYDGGCLAFTPGEGIDVYDVEADAAYYDDQRDTLYLIQGSDLTAWGQGAAMTLRWRSAITTVVPGAASFSCGKVVASDYPVRLRVFADGDTVIDQDVASVDMFRLPAGYTLHREWEVEIESSGEVYAVHIATSPSELP